MKLPKDPVPIPYMDPMGYLKMTASVSWILGTWILGSMDPTRDGAPENQ